MTVNKKIILPKLGIISYDKKYIGDLIIEINLIPIKNLKTHQIKKLRDFFNSLEKENFFEIDDSKK